MTTHRTLLVLALAATAACFSADPSVGLCKVDADCGANSSCDTGLHVCVSQCSPTCLASQQCVNGACLAFDCRPVCGASQACNKGVNPPVCVDLIGAITVTDNPAAGSNGFYPRSASVSIPVTVVLNGGSGTIASATLSAGSVTGVAGTNTSGNTWAFTVPTTAQTVGSETPLQFTISATLSDGTTVLTATEPATAAPLKIDDKGPTVSAVTVVGGVTGQDGNKWFLPSAATKFSIQATVIDSGSGLVASTLQLQNVANTRIDDGAPTIGTAGSVTFHVAQNPALISGAEGLVSFHVAASDNLGHATASTPNSFGIDGKAPVLTFATIPYPAARTGCSTDTANVFCGHDGAHFWRNESQTLSFTVSDGGVGVDGGSGTCIVNGATTCTATFAAGAAGGGTFSFPVDFSKLNVITDPKGNFTVALTMGAKDLLGNVATTINSSVDMTRVKWVRKLANFTALAGAPILSTQLGVAILAGTVGSGDPIVALNTTNAGGDLSWSVGGSLNPSMSSVVSNMALDTTASADLTHPTPILYVNSGVNIYGIHLTTTGEDKYCTTGLGTLSGSPIMFSGGATAKAVVSVGTQLTAISALNPTAAGSSCHVDALFSFGTTTNPVLGPPSANGQTVYVGYDNNANVANDRGIASVTYNGSNLFSGGQSVNLSLEPTANGNLNPAAITPASDLFFGSDKASQFFRYNGALTHQWTTTTAIGTVAAPPTVSGSLVFGAVNGFDVFNLADGTLAWSALGTSTQVTPPALGSGVLYLSAVPSAQVHAIDATTHTDKWTYGGSGTTAPPSLIAGLTTEPTLGADGTLYFGNVGSVHAIITDTLPASVAAGDWPRTGFDTCNSNHANNPGFSCQ